MNWLQIEEGKVHLNLASMTFNPLPGTHRFRLHTHSFLEWGLVLSGRCDWWVEGERFTLCENDLILVPEGRAHQERISKGEKARLAWIGMTLENQERIEKPSKIATGRWAAEIRRLFLALYTEQSEIGVGSEQRIGLCLRELLLLIARIQAETPRQAAQETDRGRPAARRGMNSRQVQLAHAAARYFENHIGQPIRIQSVAHYFQLSPQHFSVLFHKVHGVSPIRYVQEARHRQACHQLRYGTASIKEIAADCGYADSAHFCRQFKAREGCSPTRYRDNEERALSYDRDSSRHSR